MDLSREEQMMAQGKFGPVVEEAMEILIKLGEIYEAKKMVKVASVHMPGSSVTVAGEGGTRFVKRQADRGGRFIVQTSLNPAAMDFQRWQEMRVPLAFVSMQRQLTEAYSQMGAVAHHTCVPYLVGNAPRLGEHIAWGESSAVAFANSVLGARTNREGGPSALASALTGRAPLYGFHLRENRVGKVLVHVQAKLKTAFDYGTLGYFVGKICGDKVPVFKGISHQVRVEELKMLSAALATSGAVALFHAIGVTPEALTDEQAFGRKKPEDSLTFGQKEHDQTVDFLTTAKNDYLNLVVVGCPHSSIEEIRSIAQLLVDKKINPEVDFWVCTSLAAKAIADRMGYTEIMAQSGGKLICDTCPVLAPMDEIIKANGYTALATNSAKLAHYAAGKFSLPVYFGSLSWCLRAAAMGKWH